MAWVMHSEVRHRPWCLTFYIGSIPIATVDCERKSSYTLHIMGSSHGPFTSASAAMKEMHRLLNEPPPVGEASDDS